MIPAVLDHVALAVERHADAWPRYAGELGGRWVSGGDAVGFSPAQVAYANGMRLELLAPHLTEQNDFLRRFLDRNGPGPHHLTFKVPDLDAALAAAERAGYRPVGVDRSDPGWMEAFLHPKDGPGVVIQLAQAAGAWQSDEPPGFPPARDGRTAALLHIAHAVASLDDVLRLFAGLLGGAEIARGDASTHRWADLAWEGPGRIRLLAPQGESPLAVWLADRPGRIHHLAFATHSPADLLGAKPGEAEGIWTVEPEENGGTRLLLADADAGAGAEAFAAGPAA